MEKERYWTFIMYPQSMPKDWKEYLQQTGLKIAISPLHNKDKNADETQKKEHYHILLCFSGPTTYTRVEKITKYLNATIPKRVMSVKGIIRYFTHKDNPEKEQYNEEDIISINGMDIKDYDGLTQTRIEYLKKEIVKYIRQNKIYDYSVLYDKMLDEQNLECCEVISKNTIFFNTYLKSKKWIKEEFKNKILK